MEILFLATSPQVREAGYARMLQQDLEVAAKKMGCSAMCVAAVPKQGIQFWTQKSKFQELVPLAKPVETGEQDPADVLGEPVNELGHFLLRNMMLFSDTPLVAKVLESDHQESSPAQQQQAAFEQWHSTLDD